MKSEAETRKVDTEPKQGGDERGRDRLDMIRSRCDIPALRRAPSGFVSVHKARGTGARTFQCCSTAFARQPCLILGTPRPVLVSIVGNQGESHDTRPTSSSSIAASSSSISTASRPNPTPTGRRPAKALRDARSRCCLCAKRVRVEGPGPPDPSAPRPSPRVPAAGPDDRAVAVLPDELGPGPMEVVEEYV